MLQTLTTLIFNFSTGYTPCRGAIRRELPANQPALRPFTNLNHFYPVAERGDSRPHFAGGMRLGAAGIRRAYTATENQYHLNIGVKSPLVKVLEILKNFF